MEPHRIEHRYESRLPAVVGVEVWHRDLCLGRFRTRNLCREGMFIETGPTGLRPNDLVRVVVRTPAGSHEAAAMVVHRSERGVGVTCAASELTAQQGLSRAVGG